MSVIPNAEIIRQKIESFVQDTPEKFEALLAQLTRLGRRIMGEYYDADLHGGPQMFVKIYDKIESGDRTWDYENINIEAMFHNSAKSILSGYLKKELNKEGKTVSLDEIARQYEPDQIKNLGYYKNGILPAEEKTATATRSYNDKPVSGEIIEEMTKRELMRETGKVDPVVLKVMEAIKNKGVKTRKEIAEILNIDENLVRNAFEKIHRAGDKVFEKLSEADKEYIKTFKTNYRFNETRKRIKEREETNKTN